MLVVVLRLNTLGMQEFSSKLGMDMLKAMGKVVSSRDSGAFSELGFEGGVKSEVGEEGSLFSRGILSVVKSEFSNREIINPIILLVRTVRTQVVSSV